MAPPRLPALLTLLAWTGAGAGVAGGVSLCTSDAARSSSGPEASVETFHSLRCTAGPDNGRDCADGEDDATYTTPEAYAVGSSRIPITWQVRAAPRLTPRGHHKTGGTSPPSLPPPLLLPSRLAGGLQSPDDCGRPARPSRRRGQPRVELAMHAPRGRPRARARSCEQGRERAHSERNGSSSPQLAPPSQRRAHRAHETGVARALDARHSCLRHHFRRPLQCEWQLRVLFQLCRE